MNDFDEDYYENGPATGKSLYQNYRWIPELTIPMAHHIALYCDFKNDSILDFGCAKGYVVRALRLLGYNAYGCDSSEYAISEAPKEIEEYVYTEFTGHHYDWILAKDVLEHIPHESMDDVMSKISKHCDNLFVMVPLGDGKKYNIPAYELDPTHHIREDLEWWTELLVRYGFNVQATHDMGPFKTNWQTHDEGNGLLIGKKDA